MLGSWSFAASPGTCDVMPLGFEDHKEPQHLTLHLAALMLTAPVHTCWTVVTGGCVLGMMMARPKCAAECGTTDRKPAPSRTCRCQSSGRRIVRLSTLLVFAMKEAMQDRLAGRPDCRQLCQHLVLPASWMESSACVPRCVRCQAQRQSSVCQGRGGRLSAVASLEATQIAGSATSPPGLRSRRRHIFLLQGPSMQCKTAGLEAN